LRGGGNPVDNPSHWCRQSSFRVGGAVLRWVIVLARRAAEAGCVVATIGWPAASFGEPAAPAALKTKSGTHLYVMLGFNDMSPGLAEFGARMTKRGIPTTVGSYADWRKFAAEAQRQYETGRVKITLIVGHSLGGGAGRAMAARLARNNRTSAGDNGSFRRFSITLASP
jgi:pimeloyl-ACP methyl ester carboxylesterase